jgi:hypothetical protein
MSATLVCAPAEVSKPESRSAAAIAHLRRETFIDGAPAPLHRRSRPHQQARHSVPSMSAGSRSTRLDEDTVEIGLREMRVLLELAGRGGRGSQRRATAQEQALEADIGALEGLVGKLALENEF